MIAAGFREVSWLLLVAESELLLEVLLVLPAELWLAAASAW